MYIDQVEFDTKVNVISNKNHMISMRVKMYYFIIKMHNLCHNFKPNDRSPAYNSNIWYVYFVLF